MADWTSHDEADPDPGLLNVGLSCLTLDRSYVCLQSSRARDTGAS